ncbi:Uncharacterised protein [Mycobacterium tuberculosis]|uniref:Uncharacterized protein n=1 Tax=Mycobacterium tuberculosis TaxID=1773 RepID=A0A916LBC5_MYCTX|nr:Uncharacterised protein [Mycobacterium tuberculosis]CPA38156.1 Uncharacterised protein [Mycobacterium tuberculosis]
MRLLRKKKSKTCSPKASATSSEASMARSALSKLDGNSRYPIARRSSGVRSHTLSSACGPST